ncbi:MAG: hypothetical protein ABJB11_22385 [Ferruginibacter sp.]
MKLATVVRFLEAPNYSAAEEKIEKYLLSFPNWEVVSLSHALFPEGISAALVLKYRGDINQFTEPAKFM